MENWSRCGNGGTVVVQGLDLVRRTSGRMAFTDLGLNFQFTKPRKCEKKQLYPIFQGRTPSPTAPSALCLSSCWDVCMLATRLCQHKDGALGIPLQAIEAAQLESCDEEVSEGERGRERGRGTERERERGRERARNPKRLRGPSKQFQIPINPRNPTSRYSLESP